MEFVYFTLGIKTFGSVFTGENKLCKDPAKSIQTYLKFFCDPQTKWNTTAVHNHGGAMSPKPVSLTFDKNSCMVSEFCSFGVFLKIIGSPIIRIKVVFDNWRK